MSFQNKLEHNKLANTRAQSKNLKIKKFENYRQKSIITLYDCNLLIFVIR
jgi:hypothetical protein